MRFPKLNTATDLPALGPEECFAKTSTLPDGHCCLGQTVLEHSKIVGAVAQELRHWWPEQLCNKWLPEGTALLASEHDLGKVTPAFQEKIRRATDGYQPNSNPSLRLTDPSLEKQWGWHSGATMIAVQEWFHGLPIPLILGLHHGSRPKIGSYRADDEVLGGPQWQAVRRQLALTLEKEFGSSLPEVTSDLQAKVLAGFTTVADWIGSNENLLSDSIIAPETARHAVAAAGFVRPQIRKGLSFRDIFGFSENATQATMAKVTQPGVYILEAVMGAGKTEAALFAAYKLLAQGLATGIYFALPTQTTSNSIYQRVNAFLQKILVEPDQKALLVHGKSSLVMQSMGAEAAPGSSWFTPRKRSILAPFGVGTIDQALMSVMGVKHAAVRTLGLLGKVVILDEVHSYDMYTGTIVEALVHELRRLDCTVIILSATLTEQRRQTLAESAVYSQAYPLVTAVSGSEESVQELAIEPPPEKSVSLSYSFDDVSTLRTAVEKTRQGQQVLWIENTVHEAQDRYEAFAAMLEQTANVEVGIIHSRFTAADREDNESRWIETLGKHSQVRDKCGRILVGTQVLEQSLDIDSDFLVTRLCPTDMLLQRLGRLWRHPTTKRTSQARCEACILCPAAEALKADPKKALGSSAQVYAPYVLCRTLEALAFRTSVVLPADIRPLIEDTYRDRSEDGHMLDLRTEMLEGSKNCKGSRALQQLAQLTLTDLFGTLDDNDEKQAATRYSQIPTTDVVLLRDFRDSSGGTEITVLSGERFTLPPKNLLSYEQKARIAVCLMKNTVRVPLYLAPSLVDSLAWLSPYIYVDPDSSNCPRVCLVNDEGQLLQLDGTPAFSSGTALYANVGYLRKTH